MKGPNLTPRISHLSRADYAAGKVENVTNQFGSDTTTAVLLLLMSVKVHATSKYSKFVNQDSKRHPEDSTRHPTGFSTYTHVAGPTLRICTQHLPDDGFPAENTILDATTISIFADTTHGYVRVVLNRIETHYVYLCSVTRNFAHVHMRTHMQNSLVQ